jgi:hypothetical protein
MAGGLRSATRGTSAGYAESSRHSGLVGRLKNIEGASLGVALRHSAAANRPCQRLRSSRPRVDTTGHLRLKTVERSLMMRPSAWLRIKVRQRWPCTRWPEPRSRPPGMYFRTVLGDTCKPSLSRSSLAIRFWPHVRFSRAIWRIRARSSEGIDGRPCLEGVFHNSRHP